MDTTERQDVQACSLPNTSVQHPEGPSEVPSNSSASKESYKHNVDFQDIGIIVVSDNDSSPVAKVDSSNQQHTNQAIYQNCQLVQLQAVLYLEKNQQDLKRLVTYQFLLMCCFSYCLFLLCQIFAYCFVLPGCYSFHQI